MTTPSTADLRTWAREQGMDVGDRGRLSPDVRAAWEAAHAAPGTAGSRTAAPVIAGSGNAAATQNRPSRTRSAATSSAGATVAKKTVAKKTAPARKTTVRSATATTAAAPPPEPVAPVEQAAPVADPRIDDLQRQVGELARRLSQLERAASAPAPRRGFRRRG